METVVRCADRCGWCMWVYIRESCLAQKDGETCGQYIHCPPKVEIREEGADAVPYTAVCYTNPKTGATARYKVDGTSNAEGVGHDVCGGCWDGVIHVHGVTLGIREFDRWTKGLPRLATGRNCDAAVRVKSDIGIE